MKRFLPLLCLALLAFSPLNGQQTGGTNTPLNVFYQYYYALDFEPVIGETVPGFHSFAFAEYGSKWVFIGGRTNGMHGVNVNDGFPTEYSNNRVVVLDTTDWQWSYASLSQLPIAVADPLRSTNMQHYQKGDTLFMIGGYGWDSLQEKYSTFATLTAINLPGIIQAVENGDSIYHNIRQITDTNLAVCGGELNSIDNTFYLVMGHKFDGRYADPPNSLFFTQRYTDAIRKFNIVNTPDTLAIANFTELVDTNNYHRRDLNVVKLKYDNGDKLVAMGGVFQKTANLPFTSPVVISADSVKTYTNFTQHYNQYTTGHFVIDSNDGFIVVLLGGMGTHMYEQESPWSEQNIEYDSLVPFTTENVQYGFGNFGPTYPGYVSVSPGQFQGWDGYVATELPGYLGSNSKFIADKAGVVYNPAKEAFNSNLLDQFGWYPSRVFVGYLFGGIRGTQPNNAVSSANDTIYRVYYRNMNIMSVKEVLPTAQIKNLYPNPANDNTVLQLAVSKPQQITVSIIATNGALQQVAYTGKAAVGSQNISLDTAQLAAGLYFVSIHTPEGLMVKKLSITR